MVKEQERLFTLVGNKTWYFRNSLVRSDYKNFEKNVFEDTAFIPLLSPKNV